MPAQTRSSHVCKWDASVAIDIGTTFSGYCIIQRSACEQHALDHDEEVICPVKFPTRLARDENTDTITFVGPDPPSSANEGTRQEYKNFKLALMADEEWDPSANNANPALLGFLRDCLGSFETPGSSSELIATSLKGLWDLALAELEQLEVGAQRTRGQLQVIIAYPHYWDTCGLAKGRFEEALRLAGLKGSGDPPNVLLMTEHAAAAWSAAHDLQTLPEVEVQPGDPIIITNCGGINIDVIAINYPGIDSSPETAEPSGAHYILDGSVAIDFNFDNLITQSIERVTGKTEEDWTPEIRGEKQHALDKWIKDKPNFTALDLMTGSFKYKVEGKPFSIHRDDMISIFRPASQAIVKSIVALCRKPECKSPKVVFMTGGLSLNPQIQAMVRHGLRCDLGDECPTVLVREDHHIWNAVQYGAARRSSYRVVLRSACEQHPWLDQTICPLDFPTRLAISQSTGAVKFVGPDGRSPALQVPPMLYQDFKYLTLPLVLGGDWATASSNADPALLEHLRGYISNINTTMDAAQLASISLKGLWELARGDIQMFEAQGVKCRISVVITYPNGWDSGVKGRFENAAHLAGIAGFADSLAFIPEHEAVARAMPSCLLAHPLPLIKAGDPIIVVNGGDVTIDVTAINLPTTGSSPDTPASSGTKCLLNGLFGMDINFWKLITKALERSTRKTEQDWSPTTHKERADASARWDKVKLNFSATSLRGFFQYSTADGRPGSIHRDDLITSIFRPATLPIADAIVDFCRRPECNSPKAVVLVGPMSQNPEIKEFVQWGMRQALQAPGPPIFVLDDFSCIVPRGAAEYGLSRLN
ncbi:uncharacterized protein E0L32_012119 [Thyridium curvatum]|uniref:Actin-like ATPase domain-containing protein n=1 Tax=Thyridium curvatum TaxID=1093900 RepID=A0A507B399_9PEZI|nr:uncharacterized protein E0L32_012119 [Thyridium curvatum]TPX17585.1 hypothetical protein E0L32_012119 [Thyridium curvatum]